MNICYLTKYCELGASSRYRSYQFAPLFRAKGHTVDMYPMFDRDYLTSLYESRTRSLRHVLPRLLRRLVDLWRSRSYDLVVMEKEAFPWIPGPIERVLLSPQTQLVLDFDDAIYRKYEGLPWLRSKIPRLMARSQAVVVANRDIEAYATRYNDRTVLVPTVVDVDRYRPRTPPTANAEPLVIVWIGTPVTAEIARRFEPTWQAVSHAVPNVTFRFIGAGPAFSLRDVRYEVISWSEQAEADLLATASIGIMPLEDTPFQRGKSALKIIQYMAVGIPVVASPVGANTDVVRDKESGFLAHTPDDWVEAIGRLATDREARERMGQRGRQLAVRDYSLQTAFPILERLFSELSRDRQASSSTGEALRQ